jgi:transcriptional regulator with XRE-family HTH domain
MRQDVPMSDLMTLRRQRGWSQEALAARMQVDHTTVSKWERGLQVPPEPTQHRLAGIFDVPVVQLGFARGPVADGQSPELAGTWHAIWQTRVEGEENINSEVVEARQGRRDTVVLENRERSPENPIGSFLWRAECRLYDGRYLMGAYVAREPNIRSKGTLYYVLHAWSTFMLGRWAGVSYDSEMATGLSVLARDAAVARARIDAQMAAEKS